MIFQYSLLSVPPYFEIPIKDANVMEGEKLLFQATIVGKPEPDIIWFKNDKPVVTNKRITPSKKNNCYELEILSCETVDSGQYSIKASNAAGESQTQAVALVKQLPSFDKGLEDKISITGQSCQFEVIASGVPDPSLSWYKRDTPILADDHFKFVTKGHLQSLCIEEVILDDDGEISVLASNDAGSVKSVGLHTVHGENFVPNIIKNLSNSLHCFLRTFIEFSAMCVLT